MADRLRLEVATPMRLVVSGEADEVVVPGVEGSFGVLPGHAPLLSLVGIGEVMYRTGREEHHLAVSGGFAEVGSGPRDDPDRDGRAARGDRPRPGARRTRDARSSGFGSTAVRGDRRDAGALRALPGRRARLQTAGRRPGGA